MFKVSITVYRYGYKKGMRKKSLWREKMQVLLQKDDDDGGER